MGLERLQVAGTHSAIYEAYYHQVDPNGAGTIQALDAARFLKKSRLSDVVLSKIWDLSDPTGKGYLDKAGLFVALKLVALAQAGKDINMSNIHSEAPPPKVGELPKVPPVSASPPARPAAPSPAPVMPLSDWSMKPAERDKYSQLFDSLQPNNGLIAGNKVKGMLMESKLPIDTLGKIWDLADQDKDGMLDRHEFMVAMHLVYKALEKHAVPTTLPPELRMVGGRPARPASRPPSRPPSRPASRPASPGARPPRPAPPHQPHAPPPSNATLLEGLLDLSSPPTQTAPPMAPMIPPVPASLNSSMMNSISSATQWVVTDAEKALFDTQFAAADTDRDGFVSGNEIKHVFLDSGLPQQTLAHIWALCDTEGVGKLSRSQFALAMWLVQRALRGVPPPPALTPDMQPPPEHAKTESIMSLGPQPTPEMEAIAREVDALARERLALEAELAAKQRDLAVKTGEADSLQSELDTLTATLKQLENQKGEAQKRLNDLKTQVEKLRSQVSAQEAAAAETEAEVAARRAAAHTLREKERALQADVAEADAEAEALTAQLRRTVLAVSQANIKISYLEEQHRVISEAAAALAGADAAGARLLQLAPQFSAAHVERAVRAGTPSDALEDEPFAKSNGFASSTGFDADPFAERTADPFAPQSTQDGFGTTDPFSSNADPFAGDAFAAQDNKLNEDADPFAVLHAPPAHAPAAHAAAAHAPAAPALPPKHARAPPPRPAPPRPADLKTDRQAAMDFADDPFKDYRYEDPFNIEDPFADVTDSKRSDPFGRPTSVAGFETDDFFSAGADLNGGFAPSAKRSGRVSAPPVAYDPFSSRGSAKPAASAGGGSVGNVASSGGGWAAWPNDNWATDDAWPSSPATRTTDAWPDDVAHNNTTTATSDWKTDNWANKTDNWAADWGATDSNKNLNETWPSNTLPAKKEKSPRRVAYARSLVHTIGGIGRAKQKDKKSKAGAREAAGAGALPTEEQQWAWAAAESRRLQAEADARRLQEDQELQLALAISRQDK